MEKRIQDIRAKISDIDFFLKILPLKDDGLVTSDMKKKIRGHRLGLGEDVPGRTPKSE